MLHGITFFDVHCPVLYEDFVLCASPLRSFTSFHFTTLLHIITFDVSIDFTCLYVALRNFALGYYAFQYIQFVWHGIRLFDVCLNYFMFFPLT